MILAADIGGTKCQLALFRSDGDQLHPVFHHRYLTSEYARKSFDDILDDFCRRAGATSIDRIIAAGFGAAGAVVDGHVHSTNVPWHLGAKTLARKLNLNKVLLLNDVAATAFSLPHLAEKDLLVLNQGMPHPAATKALIAPGTGLGQAILFWDGNRHHVAPSEGGEAEFAPCTTKEIELLQYLKRSVARVRCEDVVSGCGFLPIHQFLDPGSRHAAFDGMGADPAQEITKQALAGSCDVCVETLDLWTAAYGAEAGNLALRVLALGGIYLAGGVTVKILDKIKDGTFFRSFCDKSNFAPILARIPIYVILNEDAPLWGAAYQAFAARVQDVT